MRKSNLILTGLVLSALILFSATGLIIRTRHARGNYVSTTGEAKTFKTKSFATHNHVSVRNAALCVILPSDSLKVGVEQSLENLIRIESMGDTIIVNGNKSGTVRLYLPYACKATFIDSEIELRGNANFDDARSYQLQLFHSQLQPTPHDLQFFQVFALLQINAFDSSMVVLKPYDYVRTLVMTMDNNSSFESIDATLDSVSVVADATSKARITGNRRTIKIR